MHARHAGCREVFAMFRYRVCFAKGGKLRFIGHLDFLRAFQAAIRRAALPAAFSQGFNPHLLLSFALPLPVGMESARDYADLVLTEEVIPTEIVARLTAADLPGLAVHAARPVDTKAAGIVAAADYTFTYQEPLPAAVEGLLARSEIFVEKRTKKGLRQVDIRPDIFALKCEGANLHMHLSAGSARFVNPFAVASLVTEKEPEATVRAEMYDAEGRPL
jgi:radical SAM-linked protein